MLYKLLASGVSMRRCAIILDIHQITVRRKLIYLAKKARLTQKKFLKKFENNPIQHFQLDDLITIEHTKLKPLSVSVAVDVVSRAILGVEVSQIPAFGHIAELSRKKYGKRKSYHRKGLIKLIERIEDKMAIDVKIESDQHKTYLEILPRYFPKSEFLQYKSERASITGQGEMKKKRYDPLFSINHTLAMMRANINRLFRRSWCTTKDPKMLKNHLDLYIAFHNTILI